MIICRYIKDVEKQIDTRKIGGLKSGFVPTMGALHNGHILLIKASKKVCDLTICSIFVNPTQFNDPKDFEKYPNTLGPDIEKLHDAGCDILFIPTVAEMYPRGFTNKDKVDFGFLAQTLEGEHRPGHFDGMAQIVEKLLRIVKPDKLFMGQKDYQQQLIVKQLIKKRGLKTALVMHPTVREADGLAMSSRNVRLDEHSRKLAVELSKTLKSLKFKVSAQRPAGGLKLKQSVGVDDLINEGLAGLAKHKEFDVEYLEIRDAETLKPLNTINKNHKAVALVAAKIGGVRLIDNMLLY